MTLEERVNQGKHWQSPALKAISDFHKAQTDVIVQGIFGGNKKRLVRSKPGILEGSLEVDSLEEDWSVNGN